MSEIRKFSHTSESDLFFSDQFNYVTSGAKYRMDSVKDNFKPQNDESSTKVFKIPPEIALAILTGKSFLNTLPAPETYTQKDITEAALTRRQIRNQERELERQNHNIKILASNALCRVMQKIGLGK